MDRYSEIAKIAYELYMRRQGAPGDPQTDWFVAEGIFAERQAQENQEVPTTQKEKSAAPADSIKRTRARAKSNGSSQPQTVSNERSSAKRALEKIAKENTPRKKR